MINELIKRYPALESQKENLEKCVEILEDTYNKGGKILVCGNGGSAADSEHIVGELMKGFLSMRPVTDDERKSLNNDEIADNLQRAIPAISLVSQSAIMTAYMNDVKPDMMYAQLAFGYATENDTLIGISTSGNSSNVVNAVLAAKAKGAKTISMTGVKDSKLSAISDVTLKAPETETYKIQEYHLPMYHYLCAQIEKDIFG